MKYLQVILVLLISQFSWAGEAITPAVLPAKHGLFLKNYCHKCHNAEKQNGKIRLDDVDFTLNTIQKADLWQKVLNSLNSGEMPPAEEKQPIALEKADFLDGLSTTLVLARKRLGDSGGNIVMRRLNRREYGNTIRDLLGVEINTKELPADGSNGNFDTVGSSLFMSSDQFEQYLALGKQAIEEHFARYGNASQQRLAKKIHIEAEEKNDRIRKALADRTDARNRYVKWTNAVDAAANKSENGDLAAKIRSEKPGNAIHIYFEWARIKGAPSPKEFGFVDAVDADEQGRRNWVHYVPYHKAYVNHPANKTGTFLTVEDAFVNPYLGFRIPGDWPGGDYVVRVKIAATSNTPASRHFVEFGSQHHSGVRAVISSHQVTGTMDNPQVLEIPLKFSPSGDRGFFLQEKGTYESDNSARRIFEEGIKKNGVGPEFALWVDWVEIESRTSNPEHKSGQSEALAKFWKFRREVELHANAMVSGTYNGYFKGGYTVAKAYLDSDRTKPPSAFGKGISDEIEAKFRVRAYEMHGPSFERYLKDPLTKTGAFLTIFNVHTEEVIDLPPDHPSGWVKTKHPVEKLPPGKYILRFRIGAVEGTPRERHFVQVGSRAKEVEFSLLNTFQISGTTKSPQVIEMPITLTAEGPRSFVLRERRDIKGDHAWYTAEQTKTGVGPPPALWVDWVEWEGPVTNQIQQSVAKFQHIEVEARSMEVGRIHERSRLMKQKYDQWKTSGGDVNRLKEFGFNDKDHAEFHRIVWEQNNRWFQQYMEWPKSKSGLYLDNTVNETSEYAIDLPGDATPGEYVMRVRIGKIPNMPTERAFLSFVQASPIDKDDRTFLANRQIMADIEKPEIIELPFRVVPNGPRKFILMEKRPLKKGDISLPGATRLIKDSKQRDPVLWIDWIEWEGPMMPNPLQNVGKQILFAKSSDKNEHEYASEILEKFASKAFRGKPVNKEFVSRLLGIFTQRRKAGDSFEASLKDPLSVILASPYFLYLVEPSAENSGRKLTSVELASRLSYFLWSAPPDDSLLALARSGEIQNQEVLLREVDRMIADPKSTEFVHGFVHQWLGMDRLDFFQFDTKLFRDFDESTKAAARKEVYETFAELLRSNQSITRLLKSDEIYVNGLLASYYGIEGVSGDEFRKVKLPQGSPRGGLLGMAAILAMGSNGERTSPVERGAWILRKLLHDPPPPAPANVPQLSRLENKILTTRERLLAHQEQPQCASCHRKIDPIGFGLENFDAAGKWRTEETYEKRGVGKKTWQIDASATFHNGPKFSSYFEMRDIIASKGNEFARGFTESLVEYALGRPCGFTDEILLAEITTQAKSHNYAISQFIRSLVTSQQFQKK